MSGQKMSQEFMNEFINQMKSGEESANGRFGGGLGGNCGVCPALWPIAWSIAFVEFGIADLLWSLDDLNVDKIYAIKDTLDHVTALEHATANKLQILCQCSCACDDTE